VVGSFAVVGLGLIAAVLPLLSPEKGAQGTHILLAVILLISGVYYPIESLPAWLQPASVASPAFWALNAQRKARGEAELSTPDFVRKVREVADKLNVTQEMLRRPLNVGFSGGEKKRNEIMQMALLAPSLCVMDETDSGLDIDALRVVADGVNALKAPDRSTIVITHYQRLLNYIVPDVVHVLSAGRIVKTGGKALALASGDRIAVGMVALLFKAAAAPAEGQ